ncbi:hypothetical protein V7S43_018401 [Phytophthora oleae]|uniref:RxLR effector protein n=1 Tax=Phytophthora oleae TaxID=2107226 RepID=A0ABD3ESS2_9STRA
MPLLKMLRLLMAMAIALLLVAMTLGSDTSGSLKAAENSSESPSITVDDTHNTTVFQPADDFLPKGHGGNGNEEASKAKATTPSDGNGGGLSTVAVGVIVSVTLVGVVLCIVVIVYAWRASRREEEAIFMDLGDERNYAHGGFGDYAAM